MNLPPPSPPETPDSIQDNKRSKPNLHTERAYPVRRYIIMIIWVSFWLINLWQSYQFIPNSAFLRYDKAAYLRSLDNVDYIDVSLIVKGLDAKPSFLSTFHWYHSTWAGIVPFWRPLTSQLFWLEYHIFTPDRFDLWSYISIISHFALLIVMYFLIRDITQSKIAAALSVFIFNIGPIWMPRVFFTTECGAYVAMSHWKDQPDIWCALATLTALLLTIRQRWAGVILACVAAICIKESGWFAFAMIPILLAARGEFNSSVGLFSTLAGAFNSSVGLFSTLAGAFNSSVGLFSTLAGVFKAIPRHIYIVTFICITCLIFLRAISGHEVFQGYHQGTLKNGPVRYMIAASGVFITTLLSMEYTKALLGLGITAIIIWKKRWFISIPLLIALIVVCSIMECSIIQSSFDVALTELFLPRSIQLIVPCVAFLLSVWLILKRQDIQTTAIVVTLFSLIACLPIGLASQTKAHVLYLAYVFQAALQALVTLAVFETIRNWILLIYNHNTYFKSNRKNASQDLSCNT